METQKQLVKYNENLDLSNVKFLIKPKKDSLELEKQRFIEVMTNLIDSIKVEKVQYNGRPKFGMKDILKSLMVMSYNGMSYRRAESDLIDLKEKGVINKIPKRSTLNKYMMLSQTRRTIDKLIRICALFFADSEDTLIIDSTWLATKMYTGGYQKVYKVRWSDKSRKLHIACLKNSRIIACARVSDGTAHDSPFFKNLVSTTVKTGFTIKKLLADAGYCSKENYAFCQALNINNVYMDFRKNATIKRSKSQIWREKLKMFKENPEMWHEHYRFRVLVEGVFSAIKRKQLNYIRSKKMDSQGIELLLKALCYNITILSKYCCEEN